MSQRLFDMKALQTKILETERLLLREITPAVYDYVFKAYNDYELMMFFGFKTAEDLLQEKERLNGGLKTFSKTVLYFQLIEKKSKIVIGMCGYHTWYLQHARAELFYVLNDDENKRNGFISEAMSPILKYGFEVMKLNRIEAFVGPDNIASQKIMKKFGFIYEGNLRKHYCKEGEYQDSNAYALLKDEFVIN